MHLDTPPLDFIVLALPRSGTTWLSNWLTTDRTLCLHDPFSLGMPEAWPRDHRLRGISCTGAALMPRWLARYTCPIAIIERNPEECDASLARLGLPDTDLLREALGATRGLCVDFDELWREGSARALWHYLMPASIPFDALRYRLLREMHVQPMNAIAGDKTTSAALLDAGLLEGRL